MSRPRQVREIFFELRRTLGAQVSSRDLLELAAAVVERFHGDDDDGTNGHESGAYPFDCRPVDVALADGGWRVMAWETRRGMALTEEDSESRMLSSRLRSLMRLAA